MLFGKCFKTAQLPRQPELSRIRHSAKCGRNLYYLHNPLQPGPMYFKTARKCAVFGICCEDIPRQINYLIDEASDCGKGANTVISLLHHFFESHNLGEINISLHADNCVGQDKNNAVLQVSFLLLIYVTYTWYPSYY